VKDIFGVCLSGLCVMHCLLTPLLLLFGSAGAFGIWLESAWVHYALLAPISLLLVWSLPFAWSKHRQSKPLLVGAGGFSALVLSLFVPETLEPILAIAGSLLLITAHLLNRHLLKIVTQPTKDQ